MKTTLSPSHPLKSGLSKPLVRRRPKQAGIAIITVLSVLLLMSVLVLAFFSLASNEYTASNNYEYGIRSKQAADTAISMVIGQIRKATTQKNDGTTAGYQAWASQPGMITAFGTTNSYRESKEAATTKFKLYSSNKMEAFGDYNPAEDVPANWIDHPESFCDLNEPVVEDSEGALRLHFPIADPRAFRGSWSQSDGIDSREGPEGFAYTDESSSGERIEGIIMAKSADDPSARLPMPVRWLYMLDDGTTGYLSDAGKFVRTYGIGTPSDSNQLSYRFAFWTDDESCKLNLNTAAEGTYWDLPRNTGASDKNFAKFQPVKNEFQSFPGQPSTTSLSPVFAPGQQVDTKIQEDLLNLAPKVQWGGTEGGTKPGNAPVSLDDDRLLPSVDEYMYMPKGKRQVSDAFTDVSTKDDLERARFLLTTNSRAPELTLYGTPRVSMWSMFTEGSSRGSRDTYDKTIAYCSTLPRNGDNKTEYFFLRNHAGSRHNENYDQAGGHNSSILAQYLTPMTDVKNPIPGIGGSLAFKFGSGPYGDANQITTLMMDYMRNINTGGTNTSYFNDGTIGQVAPMCMCGGVTEHNTRWSSITNSYPKGYGRHYTLSELALVFIKTAEKKAGSASKGSDKNLKDLADNQSRLQVGIVAESFCASHGFIGILPNLTFQIVNGNLGLRPESNVDGADNIPEIGVGSSFNKDKVKLSTNRLVGNDAAKMAGRRVWGGTGGVRLSLADNSGTGVTYLGKTSDGGFADGHIIVDSNATAVELQETTLRVIVYDKKNDTNIYNLIQVFDVPFPSTSIPIPEYSGASTDSWQKRIQKAKDSAQGENQLILGNKKEVVRSVVVSHGDYRLVQGKRVIVPKGDTGHMQPHPDYRSNKYYAHSLVMADGTPVNEAKHEPLVQGVNYPKSATPDFPMNASESDFANMVAPTYKYKSYMNPAIGGDFDNGISIQADGAYINRADDGRGGTTPYFGDLDQIMQPTTATRTPNRLVYGPGMFGSISSGIQANVPWRTLLFRPDPLHFGAKHKNEKRASVVDPPDHLFMDLFWMPVVEPYPISEPFSTAGKVNLNYQIAPFDYIKRRTALHGIFKGEKLLAIPTSAGGTYKTQTTDYRIDIDSNETLKQFEDRFSDGEIFRSATEICEIYLVPKGEKIGERSKVATPAGDSVYDYPSMRSFWNQNRLTGDNSKERPYAGIYPRVTTKSNVYKVHMTVQSLKKARSTDDDTWDEERDRVTSQWRGSAVIERAVDPNDPEIPNYAVGKFTSLPNLEVFYNYRVLNVKQFSP